MKQAKNKIINNYTQIISEMEKLNMSKEQQIEYLKSRLISSDYENRRKLLIERLLLCGLFFLFIGFFLIFIKLYFIGLVLMLMTCIFLSYKLITLSHQNNKIKLKENTELEKLNLLLDTKLK